MKISHCSLGSIVAKLRAGRPENRGWIPGRGSPSPPSLTGTGIHHSYHRSSSPSMQWVSVSQTL